MLKVKKADRREEARRIARNYLFRDKVQPSPENMIDRELSPPRQGTKVREYGWKGQAKNKWSAYGSDYDTGARSSNEAPTWSGTKTSRHHQMASQRQHDINGKLQNKM